MSAIDKEPKEPTAFTPEKVALLFRVCRLSTSSEMLARDHAILALLVDTGLSLSELASLRRDRLRVEGGADGEAYVVVAPKRSDQYRAPLGRHARAALQRYLNDGRPPSKVSALFLNEAGEPLTPQALTRLLARLGERVEELLEGTPITVRSFHSTFLAVRSRLGTGESVLDHFDVEYRRQQRSQQHVRK